jgi:L-asparaginase II
MNRPTGPIGVRLWRGEEIESLHSVSASVADATGREVARHGDSGRRAYLRSSAKPIQLLPLVEEGVAERFSFTDAELAVMTASHNAEPAHVEAVRSILDKAGLRETDLGCGAHEPMGASAARALRESGGTPTAVHNNCSGKHAGMLAVCLAMGWPLGSYLEAGHPLQRRILATLAELSATVPDEIGVAVDGCGAPTFALPVTAMARAWAALAAADARRESDRERAIGRILDAMVSHPRMVAGTGRLDTDLLTAAGSRVIPKTGAEGVFCAALRAEGSLPPRGLALKVVDGGKRAQDVALLALLEELGMVDPGGDRVLAAHARPRVRNRPGDLVGRLDARLPLESLP